MIEKELLNDVEETIAAHIYWLKDQDEEIESISELEKSWRLVARAASRIEAHNIKL